MPHITFPLADLRALAGDPGLTLERLDALTTLVKGEVKLRHSSDASVKVELQDTNRPDTWCVEGVARQLRQHRAGRPERYACFDAPAAAGAPAIEVDPSVRAVRPFVAGFTARGLVVDEAGLLAFIAAQEVLSKNFGRQRKTIAIGIYDGSRLRWPVRYRAVPLAGPEAFVPLAPADPTQARDGQGRPIDPARWQRPWTPAEVLADHPTGREYAPALAGAAAAPLLVDAGGEVLSFPPIINSATLGRVVPGMRDLFVEVTGTTLDQVLLAANILAANLADRGATIGHVTTRYPWDTPRGREVTAPHPLADRRAVDVKVSEFGRLLGEPGLGADEVRRWLAAYGLEVEAKGDALRVTTPAYRLDYLHPVDAVEDFAMARGYQALAPLMPQEFTVGALDPATTFADLARERLLGLGFEEAIGNILTSAPEVRARMRLDDAAGAAHAPLHGGPLVRIRNVMNENYAVLRDWLLPTLLEVERRSTGAVYPHRVFEAGEAGLWDPTANASSRTEQRLAALLVHDKAGFSELQGALDQLLRSFGLAFHAAGAPAPGPAEARRGTYALTVREHPSFIPGRAAWIEGRGRDGRVEPLGLLGEVHPEVLERWGCAFPAAAFELRLDALRALAG